jgi:hypothetical protein
VTRQISLFAEERIPRSPDRVARHMYEPRYDQGTICGSILIGGTEEVSLGVGEEGGGIVTGGCVEASLESSYDSRCMVI